MTAAPRENRWRKPLVLVLALTFLVSIGWYAHHYASLEVLIAKEQLVRNAIATQPLESFFIGFFIYLVLSLVPGTGGKGVVYGWLYGFWQALSIVTVGLTIAAMIIFFLSRYLFQHAIEKRYTRFLMLMNKHLEKEGAYYLLTLRMLHVPYSIVNPVSGASRVRSWTFLWTTTVGLLPANTIWVYVGLRLPSLQELAAAGPGAFIDLPLIAALIGCAFLPSIFRLLIARFGLPVDDTHPHDATIREHPKEVP